MSATLRTALGVPAGPAWEVDRGALRARFAWVRRMDGTPQDPIHHAAGDDVAIHTASSARRWRACRHCAREHLRAGRSFVWNATNVSRRIRAKCTRIFADCRARIRIVYVEVPEPTLRAQNLAREAPVPVRVLDALLEKWEVRT